MGARVAQLYDTIGRGYRAHRRPDPRVAAAIARALGEAATVLNVGAGAGSYEPTDRTVVAVEPSPAMIAQRAAGSAPVVQASATHLPFGDAAFDAALAVLTVHHWPDRPRGLAELARVARARVVLLTWDPATPDFWLVDEYVPEIWAIDRPIFPTLADLRGALGAISTFTKIRDVEAGLARLRRDLADGTWRRRHADLLERTELDLGYRLVVAEQPGVGRREGSSCEAPPEDRARGVLPVR